MFEKRGVDVVAMFDVCADLIGKKVGNAEIFHIDELERIFDKYQIHIAILTLPKEGATETAERLMKTAVLGIWNFTGKELEHDDVIIENVHIGDSLMTLCYEIAAKENSKDKPEK